MGPGVPSPQFFTICGDPRRVFYQIVGIGNMTFLFKTCFVVDVTFELTTNDPCPADGVMCQVIVRRSTDRRLGNHLPTLSLIISVLAKD